MASFLYRGDRFNPAAYRGRIPWTRTVDNTEYCNCTRVSVYFRKESRTCPDECMKSEAPPMVSCNVYSFYLSRGRVPWIIPNIVIAPGCQSHQILSDISSIYSHAKIANRAAQSVHIVSQVASKTRHSKVTPEHLARAWNVGLDRAKETLRVTTQKGIRYSIHPIHRRYRVDHLLHLGLQARRIVKQFYVDHMQSIAH
jgi:hypothetical protein